MLGAAVVKRCERKNREAMESGLGKGPGGTADREE